jgi:hypothetical protein
MEQIQFEAMQIAFMPTRKEIRSGERGKEIVSKKIFNKLLK